MNESKIDYMFPIPVYSISRGSELDSSEKKDIEDIIKGGLRFDGMHSFSDNSYIFNTKLKRIKEFCEQHLKIYVKKIINPKEDLDLYITQSWVNVTKPGERHQTHCHPNSIVSGAFYIETDIDQKLSFYDPNAKMKHVLKLDPKIPTFWNSNAWVYTVGNAQLLLFPSWIDHGVEPNEKQTKDVISISFNTFVRGTLGTQIDLTELMLYQGEQSER